MRPKQAVRPHSSTSLTSASLHRWQEIFPSLRTSVQSLKGSLCRQAAASGDKDNGFSQPAIDAVSFPFIVVANAALLARTLTARVQGDQTRTERTRKMRKRVRSEVWVTFTSMYPGTMLSTPSYVITGKVCLEYNQGRAREISTF